jgi:hypothetical protein
VAIPSLLEARYLGAVLESKVRPRVQHLFGAAAGAERVESERRMQAVAAGSKSNLALPCT